MGAYCGNSWMAMKWNKGFIASKKPSIDYLELYALTAAIITWVPNYKNRFLRLYCDNNAVCGMVNKSSMGKKNCMVLVRLIVLTCLVNNVSIKVEYIKTLDNDIADSLSRQQWSRFKYLTRKLRMDKSCTPIPKELLPMESLWLD